MPRSRSYDGVPDEQRWMLQEFREEHAYREVDVDGTPWRYIACGEGERALLFLPGGFLSADMWFYPIGALEGQYRIVAPDAYTLQGVSGIDTVGRALCASLDAEGIEKVTVIGLSAGGGVAQYLLQVYPERIEHAVLSHCGVIDWNPEVEKQYRRVLRLVKLLPLFAIRRLIARMTMGNPPASSEWLAFHDAYFGEAGSRLTKRMAVRFLEDGFAMRKAFVFDPQVLETWPGEILVLTSADDENSVHSIEKHRARYPRAKVHVLDEGGHHAFMFYPEEYTEVLREALERWNA